MAAREYIGDNVADHPEEGIQRLRSCDYYPMGLSGIHGKTTCIRLMVNRTECSESISNMLHVCLIMPGRCFSVMCANE